MYLADSSALYNKLLAKTGNLLYNLFYKFRRLKVIKAFEARTLMAEELVCLFDNNMSTINSKVEHEAKLNKTEISVFISGTTHFPQLMEMITNTLISHGYIVTPGFNGRHELKISWAND